MIAADACEMSGFSLAHFPQEFLEEIERHFRASVIKLTNPLDLGDLFDLEIYVKIIDRTLAQKEVDGIVFLHTFNATFEGPKSRELIPAGHRAFQKIRQARGPLCIHRRPGSELPEEKPQLSGLYPGGRDRAGPGINRRYHAEIQRVRQPPGDSLLSGWTRKRQGLC